MSTKDHSPTSPTGRRLVEPDNWTDASSSPRFAAIASAYERLDDEATEARVEPSIPSRCVRQPHTLTQPVLARRAVDPPSWKRCADQYTESEVVVRVRTTDATDPVSYLKTREFHETLAGDFVRRCAAGQALAYGANIASPPGIAEEVWASLCIHASYVGRASAWVGPANAQTPWHKDSAHNVIVHLAGERQWRLLRPDKAAKLDLRRPELNEESDFAVCFSPKEAVDTLAPETLVCRRGDVLFLPEGWLHAVRCRTAAMSINFWLARS